MRPYLTFYSSIQRQESENSFYYASIPEPVNSLEYRWQNKNLNIKSIATEAEQFLLKRRFAVAKEESESTVELVGLYRDEKHETRRITITISKLLADLSVKFDAGEDLQPILRYGALLHFLGGGLILSRKLRVAEFYQKIENEFSTEIDAIVARHDLRI
jgi:hypothetical protein